MNEDILCEAPGPNGRVCTLPFGHQPENIHAFDIALPDDVGDLLDQFMTELEQARAEYAKARKRERIMFYLWGGLACVYIVLTVVKAVWG